MPFAFIKNEVVENIAPTAPAANWVGRSIYTIVETNTAKVGDTWDGTNFVTPTPPVEPLTVSAVSALLVLDRAGLYDMVHNALSNHPVPAMRVWYDRTVNWEENHPYIQTFGPEFGLTDEQIHDLFLQARAIDMQLV